MTVDESSKEEQDEAKLRSYGFSLSVSLLKTLTGLDLTESAVRDLDECLDNALTDALEEYYLNSARISRADFKSRIRLLEEGLGLVLANIEILSLPTECDAHFAAARNEILSTSSHSRVNEIEADSWEVSINRLDAHVSEMQEVVKWLRARAEEMSGKPGRPKNTVGRDRLLMKLAEKFREVIPSLSIESAQNHAAQLMNHLGDSRLRIDGSREATSVRKAIRRVRTK